MCSEAKVCLFNSALLWRTAGADRVQENLLLECVVCLPFFFCFFVGFTVRDAVAAVEAEEAQLITLRASCATTAVPERSKTM